MEETFRIILFFGLCTLVVVHGGCDDSRRYYPGDLCKADMECLNSPCDCHGTDFDPNCQVCHDGQGCSQCVNNFFSLYDRSFKCSHCQSVFGNECLHCANQQGCQQCSSGYKRIFDDICNVHYCIDESCPTPQPTDVDVIDDSDGKFFQKQKKRTKKLATMAKPCFFAFVCFLSSVFFPVIFCFDF